MDDMTSPSPARIIGSAPVLLVADVVISANYYRDQLGFEYGLWGDPPCFCILKRDDFHLMLNKTDNTEHIIPHWKVSDNLWNVYFWVDDAKAMHQELKHRGARIDYHLNETDYGCLEFGIQDMDGYDIAFGQVLND